MFTNSICTPVKNILLIYSFTQNNGTAYFL